MSITIFRTVEMKEHKSSGLPTADVLQLDGACGSFTAQTMLEAANRLSPVGCFADYRERLIAVCEAAIAKSGPTAMLTVA